jgi:hypothetical protein
MERKAVFLQVHNRWSLESVKTRWHFGLMIRRLWSCVEMGVYDVRFKITWLRSRRRPWEKPKLKAPLHVKFEMPRNHEYICETTPEALDFFLPRHLDTWRQFGNPTIQEQIVKAMTDALAKVPKHFAPTYLNSEKARSLEEIIKGRPEALTNVLIFKF